MVIWVDEPKNYGAAVAEANPETAHHIKRYSGGGQWWAHLLSDLPGQAGEDELAAFGLKLYTAINAAKWLQHRGRPTVHYDCTPGTRQRAIRLGARPATLADVRRILRAKLAASGVHLRVLDNDPPSRPSQPPLPLFPSEPTE